jgi:hypothetical protein
MTAEQKSARQPAVELEPAERGEQWWPVVLAIIVAAGLHVALPARYRVQPTWVVPAVLLGLVAVLIVGDPGRIAVYARVPSLRAVRFRFRARSSGALRYRSGRLPARASARFLASPTGASRW